MLFLVGFVSAYSECSTFDCAVSELESGNSVKLISNISISSYAFYQIDQSNIELNCDGYYVKSPRTYPSGFNFTSVSNLTLQNCNFYGGLTVWLVDSKESVIQNNYFNGLFSNLHLSDTNKSIIKRNEFRSRYLDYIDGENNLIESNTFYDNGDEYDYGLFLSGKGHQVKNNHFGDGIAYPFYLDASDSYLYNITGESDFPGSLYREGIIKGVTIYTYTSGRANNTYIEDSQVFFSNTLTDDSISNITFVNSYYLDLNYANEVYLHGDEGSETPIIFAGVNGNNLYAAGWIQYVYFKGENITAENIKGWVGAGGKNVTISNVVGGGVGVYGEDIKVTQSSGRLSITHPIKNAYIVGNFFSNEGSVDAISDNLYFADNIFNGSFIDSPNGRGKNLTVLNNQFINGVITKFEGNESLISKNTFLNSAVYLGGKDSEFSENDLTNSSLEIEGDNHLIENNLISSLDSANEINNNLALTLRDVTDSTIKNNKIFGTKGIILSVLRPFDYGNNEISGNQIENSTYGLYLGNYNVTDNIHDNTILGIKQYSVYNNGNQNWHLENNKWGTNSEDVIKLLIWDIFDDSTKGQIYYSPWLPWGQQVIDADSDSIDDSIDNCLGLSNPGQEDSDSDRIGDLCDTCRLDKDNDKDHDNLCGDIDNCPSVSNPNQQDADDDNIGDECDNYNNQGLISIISADLTKGKAPFTARFTGKVVGGNSPVTYSWNFKDGSISNQKDVDHVFQSQGTYEVEFTATDKDGDVSTDKKTILVTSDEITINEYSPSSLSITMNEGEQKTFRVKAQKNPVWYYDGFYKGKSEEYVLSTNSRSAGTHTLKAVVDNSKSVEWTIMINELTSGKDFEIKNAKLDKLQTATGFTIVRFDVYNNGNSAETIPWKVDAGGTILSNFVSLEANGYTTVFAYWNYKGTNYNVNIKLDADNTYSESDEANNEAVLTI